MPSTDVHYNAAKMGISMAITDIIHAKRGRFQNFEKRKEEEGARGWCVKGR
jgi:hypothetical protein